MAHLLLPKSAAYEAYGYMGGKTAIKDYLMPSSRLMEILSIDNNAAKVSADGITQDVRLDILDAKPTIGDRVIVHAGFALHGVDEKKATESADFIREMMNHERPE